MRIQSIDVLRGIAILGILVMNIYFHGILTLGYVPLPVTPSSDIWVDLFNAVFADGRFRSLFCILFGTGLAIQIHACQKRGYRYQDFLKSRLNWLLIFGFVHGVFIFGGDILLLYSVCALAIVNKLTLPTRELYHKALRWLCVGAVLNIAFATVIVVFSDPAESMTRGSSDFMHEYENWVGEYLFQVIVQGSFVAFLALLSPLWVFWQVAGLMLLGVYFYRIGFFKRGLTASGFKKVLLGACVFTAIDLVLRLSVFTLGSEAGTLVASISGIFVAILYAHWVVKLMQNGNRLLEVFIAPGRLAFSLYILQSLVMAVLLRWVYPEFHLSATMVDYLAIAVAFIAVQILLANAYLRFFKQGPLEWLWRKVYQRSFAKKQAKQSMLTLAERS